MREWSTFSRFPCTADDYYAIMVDGSFQERLHVEGLKMGCWDFTDDLQSDGTLKRVVFSEPRLNLPSVIARMMSKAQSYHEYTTYWPAQRRRLVRVVPCVGGENMDFTFDEWVRDDEDGVGGCVVEASVKVDVGVLKKGSTTERRGNWLTRILERFICSTSKVKIAERDAYLNRHFTALGYKVYGVVGVETEKQITEARFSQEYEREAVVVEVDFRGSVESVDGSMKKAAAQRVSAMALSSHPLPPCTFVRRSSWQNLKRALTATACSSP